MEQKHGPQGKSLTTKVPVPQYPNTASRTDPGMVIRVSQNPTSSDKAMVKK